MTESQSSTDHKTRRSRPVAGSRLGMFVLMVATVVSVTACGSKASTTSRGAGGSTLAGQTIVLYNAQHEQTTASLVAAFTKKTGVKVKVDSNGEDVLTGQIEQEGSRSPADVVYTENSNWLERLAARGLLAKVDTTTLAQVPVHDSSPTGAWVGVSSRVSMLVYNPEKISVSQLPKSVLDMAEPRYKGKFELAPSETDFWPIVQSVAKAKGRAAALRWLDGIKANAGSKGAGVPDNETLTSDVARGTIAFALINHYYFYRLQATQAGGVGDAKVATFTPRDPGYLLTVSGAAVLKSSKHAAAAQAFVVFITSRAGQRILESGDSFEYPLAPGVPANPKLPAISSYEPNAFSPADLGTGDLAKQLLQESGLI